MIKLNAIIIDTARDDLIYEEALIETLGMHKIRGAGLDVHVNESFPVNFKLLELDNVALMVHSSEIANDIIQNSSKTMFPEIERFLCNDELVFELR